MNDMYKRLPDGISDFEVMRTCGYAYVDKTRFIEQLEADLRSMNLPPRKEGHTPRPAPKGRPTINRQHTLIAENQATGKREKPH